ncbi:MAG: hypothetical protein DSM107014_12280 [Gomphosphaeria aponina SAG 52.96 = DSM 107014]|uniref:Uncharacterized protein n=1 Tax=Gomphosphaeria aponina SAG 52.96 = DSM 107014 TaxID=1521640 RepID=A0A941JVB4_9CHRO|nr:hypothetical protein [Gomphosphaeria aponina SAG 52.96 = DSM 107014]
MLDKHTPSNYTSAEFEKVALQKFSSLAMCLPANCQVLREPWGCYTVISLDFKCCPGKLEATKAQTDLLIMAAEQLGLPQSFIFRVGKKVMGWKTIDIPK